MKNILIIIALFTLNFVLFSCETIVDDIPLSRFPEIKEKLVLTSFISPQDTTIYVKVTISSPLFGTYKTQNSGYYVANGDTIRYGGNDNNITNAIVTLSSDNQTITLPYQSKNRLYAISAKAFKIEAGKTYTLKATTKDYAVEASTTIPLENVKIDNYTATPVLRLITYYSSNQVGQQRDTLNGYEVQFSWKDVAQQNNFYKIGAEIEFNLEIPVFKNNAISYQASKGTYNANWYDEQIYPTDANQDGAVINSQKADIFNYFTVKSTFNGKTYKSRPSALGSKLTLQIANLSKEFYDYQLSLFKFQDSQDNPFAEPAPVFSNIKNGLGCFAGYNRSEKVVVLP
ncbi:MAG: DUF4249 domain-containing protein [Emticicia sp.]